MKISRSIAGVCLSLVLLFTFMLSGCEMFENWFKDEEEPVYTVMYTDGAKTYTIEVKNGDVYSIEKPLPSKQGYDFIGLYDAEIGGTQYVSSDGLSVSAFEDNRNIVLYPQFKAKTYNIILDYGEATDAGVNNVPVNYGATMPALPGGLTVRDKPHMNFTGWYTQSDSQGIQVANGNGISTLTFNSQLADLCEDNNLKLYAGISAQIYNVTFMSYDGTQILKTAQVTHGGDIADVAAGLKENGATVTTWSTICKSQSAIFKDKVTQDVTLFAVNFSKTMEFTRINCKDNNGYNPGEQAAEQDDTERHNGFSVVNLTVKNCAFDSEGKCFKVKNDFLPVLSLNVVADINKLPISGGGANSKSIGSDSYSGAVYGTNIDKQQIKKGAYYVKATFADGSEKYEKNEVNIFAGKGKNSVIDLNLQIGNTKPIDKIEIVVVYEINTSKTDGFLGVGNWSENSNWRNSVTLEFVKQN